MKGRTTKRGGPSLMQAMEHLGNGEFTQGADAARAALARKKNDTEAMYVLGMCEAQMANYDAAREVLERAVALKPGDCKNYVPLSFCHRMAGDTEHALALLDRSLSVNPRHEPTIATKAELLMALSRNEEARELLDPVMATAYKDHQIAMVYASLAIADGEHDKAIDELSTWVSNPAIPPGLLIDLLFALGRACDKASRYDEAFDAYRRGNGLKSISFNASDHARAVDQAIERLTPEVFEKLRDAFRPEPGGFTPVFVLGMPRSGTTLAERILGAHPQVYAGGEIALVSNAVKYMQANTGLSEPALLQQPALVSPNLLRTWRETYLTRIPAADAGLDFATDKMPANVQNLFLVRLLFPESPIVHCTRNPADTALSCYFQNFGSSLSFPYRLDWIASFYRDYARLTRHFTETLGIETLEFVYEDVVEDIDTHARRIVEHCGLAWDDSCLAFHTTSADARTKSAEQVNKPVYTGSRFRYRHYEKHIPELLPILDDPNAFGRRE